MESSQVGRLAEAGCRVERSDLGEARVDWRPAVDVVVPTHNRAEVVCRCVESRLRGSWADFRVTVVDDASSDGTGDLVARRLLGDGRVRYVRSETNLRQAGARNLGARVSSAELVLFLDDDNVADVDLLKELVGCAARHPELGLIAPLSVQGGSGVVWTLGSSFDFWTSRPVNVAANRPVGEVDLSREVYPTCYSPNAFLVRRSALEAVGGFDRSYGVMYEEADFGYRIVEAGFGGGVCPAARTVHWQCVGQGENGALRHLGIESRERAWLFARNRSVFLRRHAPWPKRWVALWVFTPLSAVVYGGIALLNGAPSIAWAYVKGTVAGLFGRVEPRYD